MTASIIREKLGKLIEEQKQREAQVTSWQEQQEKISLAIRQTKEAHDFTRGQISALEELLAEDEKKVSKKVSVPDDANEEE